MKTLLLASLLSLAPMAAFAGAIDCEQANTTGNADSGFGVSISADSESAVVTEESIGGPRTVAELACAPALETMEAPAGTHPFLRCTAKGKMSVEVFATRPVLTASLLSAKGQLITKMNCKEQK